MATVSDVYDIAVAFLAAKLMVKAKQADGTVRTGSLSLT